MNIPQALPLSGHPAAGAREAVPAYPVHYDVAAPERSLRRLRTAFRPLLLIPALVVNAVLGMIAGIVTLIAWLILLFSARYPRDLRGIAELYLAGLARLLTSLGLLRDELPPLGSNSYPITFWIDVPDRQSRLRVLFRGLLMVPLLLGAWLAVYPWAAASCIAWFAILISGRYPEGLRRLVVGLNRWFLRVIAYGLLLRDEFPGFSLWLNEVPQPPPTPNWTPALDPSWSYHGPSAEPMQGPYAWTQQVWHAEPAVSASVAPALMDSGPEIGRTQIPTPPPADLDLQSGADDEPGFVSRPARPQEPRDAG